MLLSAFVCLYMAAEYNCMVIVHLITAELRRWLRGIVHLYFI